MTTGGMERAQMEAELIRRCEVEKLLGDLYIRRAEREKHVSRMIPEYSEEWETDPYVKASDKKGEEKMASAEMVLLAAERRDLRPSEKYYQQAVMQKIRGLDEAADEDEAADALEIRLLNAAAQAEQLDQAAQIGQRIIRQTGYIKRCADQAMQFRFSRLSEPLKAALRGADVIEPLMKDFFRLIGEKEIALTLRDKIRYCQLGGSDLVWETFNDDFAGWISRLLHRPDLQRFSEVDVELLDIRYRVYYAMSRVTEKRRWLINEMRRIENEADRLKARRGG